MRRRRPDLFIVIHLYCVYIDRTFIPTVLQLDPVFFILLCLLLGLFSGFLGGLLGIGGGVIIVPALYLLYDTTSRFDSNFILIIAIATSLSCIIFTSASASYAQYKKGMVQWLIARKLLPSLLVGSMLSGILVSSLDPSILKIIIASFLAAVALVMISSWQPKPERRLPGIAGSSLLGAGAGIASGSAGIAGGNIIVPTLIFFNVQPHHATATSSFLGIPIAMSGALGYFLISPELVDPNLFGYVDKPAFIGIVLGAISGAPLGVRIAHRASPQLLKKLFGITLSLVSFRMFYDTLTG